eukprot:CAMPEP_0198543030 /NCGR_PEP_ID=MMETSP1462-20131121/59449_1 /TAXON_ID=1333877 /ORGANISM="Brandtodinium nutriculum, Strain RCC3387" /LENGTH=54 /DNA_ID=CAMNT_0044273291 /DNA_START=110 /DNA_END=270 /DNA_ORIENTATION=+
MSAWHMYGWPMSPDAQDMPSQSDADAPYKKRSNNGCDGGKHYACHRHGMNHACR